MTVDAGASEVRQKNTGLSHETQVLLAEIANLKAMLASSVAETARLQAGLAVGIDAGQERHAADALALQIECDRLRALNLESAVHTVIHFSSSCLVNVNTSLIIAPFSLIKLFSSSLIFTS